MSAEKLINASVAISMDAPSGDERMFCHSIMSQIGLPRTQVQGREFHHSFGAANSGRVGWSGMSLPS